MMKDRLMPRSLGLFFAGVFLLACLSGCATVPDALVVTKVVRFNSLPQPLPATPTVAFREPAKSASAAQVEAWVMAEFVKKKWAPASASTANYLIELTYGIDGGAVGIWREPQIGVVGRGGSEYVSKTAYTNSGSVLFSGSVSTGPDYGQVGLTESPLNVYRRKFVLQLIDRQTMAPVYEARAYSDGETGNLGQVIRNMIRSIFVDFPGQNGSHKEYSLPSEVPVP